MLVSNRAAIKAQGFRFCGLYQYLRAGQDPLSQANSFIGWIGPNLNEGEIPILDLEEGSGNQSSRASQLPVAPAGLLPHTRWQSTNGQVGANRANWSGCGFVDTSIYQGTLASLASRSRTTRSSAPSPSPGASSPGSPSSATPATGKVTVMLPSNCSAISFQRQDDPSNWATIACNLGI